MKVSTAIAAALTLTVGISTALLTTAKAGTLTQDQEINMLTQAISKALSQKSVNGCQRAHVKMLPGDASRMDLSIATRRAAKDGVTPKITGIGTPVVSIKWIQGASRPSICLSFDGPGHHSQCKPTGNTQLAVLKQ